tara:strand:- start:148 stop:375 length:228 start_codon:yes stop_codon:yes gene_type:complete
MAKLQPVYTIFKPEIFLLLLSLVIIIVFLRQHRRKENTIKRTMWVIVIVVLAALSVGMSPGLFLRNKKLYTKIKN